MATTPVQKSRLTERRTSALPLFSMLPFLGLAWVVGCGDDGDDAAPTAGKGGSSSGGKAGSGGKSGKAGSAGASGDGSGGTGKAGSAGSSSGSGGSGAEGGSDAMGGEGGDEGGAAGTAGSAGTAGTAGTAGSGGTTGGEGGNGGEGGDIIEPDPFPLITQASSLVVPGVSDLRGLVFATVGAAAGKIYASGHFGADDPNAVTTTVDREIAVVRFNANGTLDGDFGTGGIVRHNLVTRVIDSSGETPVITNSGNEESLGIVELASGELLLQVTLRDATGKGADVGLLKLTAAGAKVAGFGTDGFKRVDFGWVDETDNASWPTATTAPSDQGWGLQLDYSVVGTEKVVVFGFGPAKLGATTGDPPVQRTDNDRYVTRLLTSDGSRDPGFNTTGAPYTVNSGGTFGDNGRRGIVLPDGTIYASGYTNFGAGLENHVMVIRLTPAGLPDPTFHHGIALPGISRTNGFLNDGGAAECYQVGLTSTGQVVTTGYGRATAANVLSSLDWETTVSVDLVAFALGSTGAPDLSWGRSGTLAIQSEVLGRIDTEERGRDLVVLEDDRVIHAGRFGGNPAIFVVKPNGELDESTGTDGRFEYTPLAEAPAATSHFYAIAKSSDQRTIVASTNNHANGVLVAFLSVAAE